MQPLEGGQYSLAKILGIWASVALPMGLIRWVVTPILIPRVEIEPGFLYLILVTLGLVWEGVVAYIILRQEVEPFTWVNIKDRVWLHTPTNPKTGVPSNWLFLWTIPLIVFNFLVGEELIFRGILLPKMKGVFGKWDFIANGILFVAYHLQL